MKRISGSAPADSRKATLSLLRESILIDAGADAIRKGMTRHDLDWEDVLYLSDGHGITPLLCRLWCVLGVWGLIPESARRRLEQAYADNATRNQDARREFAEILRLMAQAQVQVVVLKGLPLLDELYPDPAERVLYDFDLLTSDTAQARRGVEALIAAGFTPVPTKAGMLVNKHLPSLWRLGGFVRRGYLFDVAQPRPVELHLSLWDTGWRGLDVRPPEGLWSRSRTITFGGEPVRVLDPADTLIHLCVHLATHLIEREARVGQVIDIARLLSRSGAALDWSRIVEASEQAHVSRFVYLSLHASHILTHAPMPPPNVVQLLRGRTPAPLRDWVEQEGAAELLSMDYRQVDLSRAYALTFAATRSWREKAGVLRFALFPPLQALEEEHGRRGRWLYLKHIGGRGRLYLDSMAARRSNGR